MKIVTTKVEKIWLFAALIGAVISTSAQEAEESIAFSGSVDTYFRTNLNAGKFDAPASSFANLNGFALGMVNIKAEKSTDKGGFVADLVFGPRGTDAVFASPYYSATGNIYGKQSIDASPTLQIDLTGSYELGKTTGLGINASYNETPSTGGFYGVALYPSKTIKDQFAVGLRSEIFHELDAGGPAYGAGTTTLDFTLTGAYETDELRLILECRLDQSSAPQFNAMTTDQLASILIAAVYQF
jgi:hypothetical protein